MTSNVQADAKQSNPALARDQIWRMRSTGNERTLKHIGDGDRPMAFFDDFFGMYASDVATFMTCVGIETPAGRVMVGERRSIHNTGHAVTVSEIGNSVVAVMSDRGEYVYHAAMVASWPLVPAPRATGIEPDASCTCVAGVIGGSCRRHVPAMHRSDPAPLAKAAESAERSPAGGIPSPYAKVADIMRVLGVIDPAAYDRITGLSLVPLSPPDPNAAKWARRSEIDAVLAEDARRFPAFADARRAAVLSNCEAGTYQEEDVKRSLATLAACHAYEDSRGGMPWRSMSTDVRSRVMRNAYGSAQGWPVGTALAHYERARGPKSETMVPSAPVDRARAIRKAFAVEQSIAEAYGQ